MAISPTTPFELTKSIWTENDFDEMGWHDVHIHALAFATSDHELLMDVDYMFAWVDPEPPSKHYTFWMSPCTLIFRNVHSFTANIEWGLGLEISHVSRDEKRIPNNADHIKETEEWKWVFECQEGCFSFFSTGYNQITRREPIKATSQVFSWAERGGVSFDRALWKQ